MKEISLILADRYHILDLLGEGGSGKTYRAVDDRSQTEVAVKVLNLRGMSDWKTLELFDREAKILARLEHPAIPRYLDYFQTEIAGELTFCLVQAIAPGRSLTSWVESGYLFSEAELQEIATQILEILSYLQTFTPPIIHRDLKPQNLLRSESGQIYLVDFGAVRDTYHLTITGGSTIVGTYGYMAPEQFRSQAVLSTDLYGLGTTLLYLTSGQDPADLPVKQMKIDYRDRVRLSPDFTNWLDGLLEPIPEDRYRSAAIALDYLHGKVASKLPRPKHPIARVSQQGETMKIVVPPIWLTTRSSKITLLTAALLLLLAIAIWWLMTAAVLPTALSFLCLLILMPLTVAMPFIIWDCVYAIAYHREIELTNGWVVCQTKIVGKLIREYISFENIKAVNCEKVGIFSLNGGIKLQLSRLQYYQLTNIHPAHNNSYHTLYSFGKHLDYAEQRWLAGEILEYLYLHNPKTRSLATPKSDL